MSGQGAISCVATRKECLKHLSDREFNAYTEFYTHTQNICYFLQSKLWHEESEKTIDRLSSTSFRASFLSVPKKYFKTDLLQVSMQLADAERGQAALLKQQMKSLNIQENMAHSMEISKDKINTMMEEIRLTALEQQVALGSLFNQLATLQTWAVGELSWLDSIFFYSSAAILSCLFTSMSRTRRARLPLLLIFTLNYGLERYCCHALNEESESVVEISTNLHSWVWFFRKFATVASIFIWSFTALTYCDYNVVNYKMLVQIRQQNLELREILKKLNGRDVLDSGDKVLLKPVEDWVENLENIPSVFVSEKCEPPDIARVRASERSESRSTRASSVQINDSETNSRYSLRRGVRLKKISSPC